MVIEKVGLNSLAIFSLFFSLVIISIDQTFGQSCTPISTESVSEYISRVQFPDIDRTSNRVTSGYESYSLSQAIGTAGLGTQVEISITPTWLSTPYNEGYSVWIDYNFDGDFDDPNENVLTISPTQESPVVRSFSIIGSLPDGYISGTTRMRVAMNRDAIPTSCDTFSFGEVEDYYVALKNYCSIAYQNSSEEEYISRVQIGTIDQYSGAGNYQKFLGISTNLTPYTNVNVAITPTWLPDFFGQLTIHNEAYSVYIDYNKDFDFDDVNELVLSIDPTKTVPATGSFNVKNIPGTTRMRVIMNRNEAARDACEFFLEGEAEDYTVNILSINDILSFSHPQQNSEAIIDNINRTVQLEVAFGTDLTSLAPVFELSSGASVKVDNVNQTSGTSTNNYTNPVIYTVMAADGINSEDWTVTITASTLNTAAEIESFAFNEQSSSTSINSSAKTIDLKVLYATDLSNLTAYFILSSGANAKVNDVIQVSGTTVNDFSNSVIYEITSEDGNTVENWTVNVTNDVPSIENDIIAFSVPDMTGPATINPEDHTVTLEIDYGISRSALIANFTLSEYSTAKIGGVSQVSGQTVNDFSNSVTYDVIAQDVAEIQPWIVTITERPPSTENDILSFSFPEQTEAATINAINHTIDIEVEFDTDLTNLVAEFALSEKATAKINGNNQFSGVTSNDFTNEVIYTLIAEDGSTIQDWVIRVMLAPPPPIIDTFSPRSGPIGTTVTISGSYFDSTPTNNIVYFGAVAAQVISATSSELIVEVPKGATLQPISILVDGLISYSKMPFILTFDGGLINEYSFSERVDFTTSNGGLDVASGDFDGDGRPDLAVCNFLASTVSIFKNASSAEGTFSFDSRIDFATGLSPFGVSVGDLDCDGKLDLAIATNSGKLISVLRNNSTLVGSISFESKKDFQIGGASWTVVISDVDGDGKADMAVGDVSANKISLYQNLSIGAGDINFAPEVELPTGTGPRQVAFGDFDGDNKPDLISANTVSNTLSIFRNTSSIGIMSFDAPINLTSENSRVFAIGDLDLDGNEDLVVANNDPHFSISIFRNATSGFGDISFDDRIILSGYSWGPSALSLADINGDEKIDLVLGTNEGVISVMGNESNGVGNINFGTTLELATPLGGPTFSTIADFDNDGKPDIAVTSSNTNTLSILGNKIIPPSTETDFITFSFTEQTGEAIINTENHAIAIEVAYGTDLSTLVANFTISDRATIQINNVDQISDNTVNDFSIPLVYTITAEDQSSIQNWTVTVTEALPSSETEIISFSLNEETGPALIDAINHTIAIEVETGTTVTSLLPTIVVSNGAVISPTTTQDFSSVVTYLITAQDGITTQQWTVTVSIKPLGLEDFEGLKIYPNPVDEVLIIDFNSFINERTTLTISNLLGQALEFRNINGEEHVTINVKQFPIGIYIIQIAQGQRKGAFRFIKE